MYLDGGFISFIISIHPDLQVCFYLYTVGAGTTLYNCTLSVLVAVASKVTTELSPRFYIEAWTPQAPMTSRSPRLPL